MDLALTLLAGLLILLGVIGSFLPVLPGPPLAWLGMIAFQFTAYFDGRWRFWIIFSIGMIAVTLLDYLIPIWGTKKFGGSRAGIYGSTLGLIVGLFMGPLGIILGPFLGALAGELLVNPADLRRAMRSAFGSFVGFLLGLGLKLTFCGFAIYYFVRALL